MAGVNKVILLGHLGADPEVRYTQSGQAVANMRLATSEQWNDRDGNRQERTEWHTIVVWGKQAETCGQYLSKGRQIYVEGRIQSREYTDRDGNNRRSFEIVANVVQFLGGRGEGGGGGGGGGGGWSGGGGGGGPRGGGGGGGGRSQGGGGQGGGGGGWGSGGWGPGGGQGGAPGGGQGGGGGDKGGGGSPPPDDDPIPF